MRLPFHHHGSPRSRSRSPGVHSVHDIRSRSHGGEIFIEMHMHVDPRIEHDHHATHAVTEEVEERLDRGSWPRDGDDSRRTIAT
jgi:divalent metal cation (Fe/Co/Zn/Cd) transporter